MAQTEEERREAARVRMRDRRATKAAEREAERAKSANAANAKITTAMRDAVTEAIGSMKWLVASDVASKMQALDLARIIDEATHEGDDARALSAHRALSRVLNDLGGTPSVRLARELRSLKHAPKVEGSDDGSDAPATPEGDNVTLFPRPQRRAR